MTVRARPLAIVLSMLLMAPVAACGGAPPEGLGGFELGMSQAQVMERSQRRGGFTCTLIGTRPKVTSCAGPTEGGPIEVLVRGDSAVRIILRKDVPDKHPARSMRRFARGFGKPAWSDRPWPLRPRPTERFNTVWLDRDTTRAIALTCRGRRLEPPCTAELNATTPARLQARLDSLLGIRR